MGWNLPDGCSQDDLERAYQDSFEPRCPHCGYALRDCDCEPPADEEEAGDSAGLVPTKPLHKE